MNAGRYIRNQEMFAPGFAQALRPEGPHPAASARMGKYQVHAELGHSSPVAVFRGYDREIGRLVTLKVLTDIADQPLRERFRREVALAGSWLGRVRRDGRPD